MNLNRPAGHSYYDGKTSCLYSNVITAFSYPLNKPNATPKIVITRLQSDCKIKKKIRPSKEDCLPPENTAPSVGYPYSFIHPDSPSSSLDTECKNRKRFEACDNSEDRMIALRLPSPHEETRFDIGQLENTKHHTGTFCQPQLVSILSKDLQVSECQEQPFYQSATPRRGINNNHEGLSKVRKSLENRTEAALSTLSLLDTTKTTNENWNDSSTEYVVDTWRESPSYMSVLKGLNEEDVEDVLLHGDERKRWKEVNNTIRSNFELKTSPRNDKLDSNRSQSSNEADLEVQNIWNRRSQPKLQTPRVNVCDVLERCRQHENKLSETITNSLIHETEDNAAMKIEVKPLLSKYSASYAKFTSEEMPKYQNCNDGTLYNYGFRKLHADSVSENQSYYPQSYTPQQHSIVPKTHQSVFIDLQHDYTLDLTSNFTENAVDPICGRCMFTVDTEPIHEVVLCDSYTALRENKELNAQKSTHAIHTFGNMDEEKQLAKLLQCGKYNFADHTQLVPAKVFKNILITGTEDKGAIEASTEQTFPAEKEFVEATAQQTSNVEVDASKFQSIKNSTDSNGLKSSCVDWNISPLDATPEDALDPENQRNCKVSDLKTAANARNYSEILEECPTNTEYQDIKQAVKNETSRMQCQFIETEDMVPLEYKFPLRDQDHVQRQEKIATPEKACFSKEESPFIPTKSRSAIKERLSRKKGLLCETEIRHEPPGHCTEKHAAQITQSASTSSTSYRHFITVEWIQGQKFYRISPRSLTMAIARKRVPNTKPCGRKMSPGSMSTRTTTSKHGNNNAANTNGIIRNFKTMSFAELSQQVQVGPERKTSDATPFANKSMPMASSQTPVHSKPRYEASNSSVSKSSRNMNPSRRREKKINSNGIGFNNQKKRLSVTGLYSSTSESYSRSSQIKPNDHTQHTELDGKQSFETKDLSSEIKPLVFSTEEVVALNTNYTQMVDELPCERDNVNSKCSSETKDNSDQKFTILDQVKKYLKSWVPGKHAKVSRSCSNTNMLQTTVSTD